MRMSFLLGVVLALSELAPAQPPKKEDTATLERTIKQLSARRHHDREAAVTALVAQRNPKVPQMLREAVKTGDLDTRRRAQEVLTQIERVLEAEQLTQPQMIRLEFKDIPVSDALADFTRRTGIPVSIEESSKAKVAKRTVSLDTGEVSYWEALTQLCRKAGLSEQPPKPELYEGNEWASHHRWGRRFSWHHSYTPQAPGPQNIVLIDSPTQHPTYNAGALRIHVVPKPELMGPPSLRASFTLGVEVEPRLQFSRLVSVRVEEAVDTLGQKLTQPSMFMGEPAQPQTSFEERLIVWDGMGHHLQAPVIRNGTIKLQRTGQLTQMLKHVKGKVSVEVETPMTPLVTIADIRKANGQTFSGVDGSALRVLEVTPQKDQLRLKVEVTLPPPPPRPEIQLWMIAPGLEQAPGADALTGPEVEQKGLALYDAQGQPFVLESGVYVHQEKPNKPITYTLVYQKRPDQGPAKFVLSGKRTVIVEVPFVLKDVPIR